MSRLPAGITTFCPELYETEVYKKMISRDLGPVFGTSPEILKRYPSFDEISRRAEKEMKKEKAARINPTPETPCEDITDLDGETEAGLSSDVIESVKSDENQNEASSAPDMTNESCKLGDLLLY